MSEEILQAALAYAARGIPVFPCNPSNKRPLTEHGFKNASTDEEQIKNWWTDTPNALIGMPLGKGVGMMVVDIDKRHGGPETLLSWMQDAGITSFDAHRTETPGGIHLWVTFDNRFRNSTGKKKSKGVDVRTEGGYVIVSPSVRSDGGRYEGEVGPSTLIPEWLAERILAGQVKTKVETSLDAKPIPEGERNDTLFLIGSSLRGQGWHRAEIEAHLRFTNEERCEPSLSEHDIDIIVGQVVEFERGISIEERKVEIRKELGGVEPETKTEAEDILRFLPHDDTTRYLNEEPPWIHKPFLVRGDLSILVGAANKGKTTLVLQMIHRGATGASWFFSAKPSKKKYRTMYFSLEMGEQMFIQRIVPMLGEYNENILAFFPYSLPLDTKTLDSIGTRVKEMKIDVIVIDNLLGSSIGVDLNSNTEVAELLNRLRAFARIYNVAVLLVHHTRKGSKNTAIFGEPMDEATGSKMLVNRPAIRLFLQQRGNSRLLRLFSRLGPERVFHLGWNGERGMWRRSLKGGDDYEGEEVKESIREEYGTDEDT